MNRVFSNFSAVMYVSSEPIAVQIKQLIYNLKNGGSLYMELMKGSCCLNIPRLGAETTSGGSWFQILMFLGKNE